MGPKLNWPEIRKDFVEGVPDDDGTLEWPTLADLARREDCNPATIRKRASSETWSARREDFRQRIEAERQQHLIATAGEQAAALDLTAIDIAREGLAVVSAAIGQHNGDTSASNLSAFAQAAARLYDLGKSALGALPPAPPEVPEVVQESWQVRSALMVETIRALAEAGAVPGVILDESHISSGADILTGNYAELEAGSADPVPVL